MVYASNPWRDRFIEPSPSQLRNGLSTEASPFFDQTRTYLQDLKDVRESVEWYGNCWCWTLTYRVPGEGDPIAVLIPSPEDLQMGMLVEPPFVDGLPLRRLKRGVRDGLDLASEPFDTRWAVWSMGAGTILDDLQDLVRRKMVWLSRQS